MIAGFSNTRPLQKNISEIMGTFNNRSQSFWTFPVLREIAVAAMSGFVHPPQKYKYLFETLLRGSQFYEAGKTGQADFYLSGIVSFLSKIVYI
jgi:hypothetical protein